MKIILLFTIFVGLVHPVMFKMKIRKMQFNQDDFQNSIQNRLKSKFQKVAQENRLQSQLKNQTLLNDLFKMVDYLQKDQHKQTQEMLQLKHNNDLQLQQLQNLKQKLLDRQKLSYHGAGDIKVQNDSVKLLKMHFESNQYTVSLDSRQQIEQQQQNQLEYFKQYQQQYQQLRDQYQQQKKMSVTTMQDYIINNKNNDFSEDLEILDQQNP